MKPWMKTNERKGLTMAETHFDIAVQRLTAWLRDYGEQKPKEFIGDVSIVLLAAKDTYRLERENKRLRALVLALEPGIDDYWQTLPEHKDVMEAVAEIKRRVDG